jgi:hypothetical protein
MAARKDITQEVLTPQEYVAKASFEVIRCRAGQHDWPSSHIAPGRDLPPGISVWKYAEGDIQLVEECSNKCGKSRFTWLERGGLMGNDLERGYKDPKSWIRVPRAANMTKHDWRQNFFRTIAPDLMKIAQYPAPVDDE